MTLTLYTHPLIVAPLVAFVLALIVKTILEYIP